MVISILLLMLLEYQIGHDVIVENIQSKSEVISLSILTSDNYVQNLEEVNLSRVQLISIIGFLSFVVSIIALYTISHVYVTKNLTKKSLTQSERYQEYFGTVASDSINKTSTNNFNRKQSQAKPYLSINDLNDVNNRKILLKELTSIHAMLTGDEKNSLREIYFALGFIDELEAKFLSFDWVKKVEAISEVKQFRVEDYYPTVRNLVLDSNKQVKQTAILALLETEKSPLDILDHIDKSLSRWEKHHILRAMEKLGTSDLPIFEDLHTRWPRHKSFLTELGNHFMQETKPKTKLYVA